MIHVGVTDSGCRGWGHQGVGRGSPGAAVPAGSPAVSRSGSVPQARGAEGQDDPTDVHLSLRAAPALLV